MGLFKPSQAAARTRVRAPLIRFRRSRRGAGAPPPHCPLRRRRACLPRRRRGAAADLRLLLLLVGHPRPPGAAPEGEGAAAVQVLARDGSVLAERGAAAPNVPVDLLPRHLIEAVLAIEDRRFFSHWGVDPGRARPRRRRQLPRRPRRAGRLDASPSSSPRTSSSTRSARCRASSRSWCWRCGWSCGSASPTSWRSTSTASTSAPASTAWRRRPGASSRRAPAS